MSFNKKSAKSTLASIGNGILNAAVLASDLSAMTRMTEIETEIDSLQAEYARLNESLDASHRRPVPYKK